MCPEDCFFRKKGKRMEEKEYSSLQENVTHGSYFSPFKYYKTRIPLNFTSFHLHWHEELELSLITKGKSIYNIDLTEYIANEGDLIIINPYVLHSIKQYNKEPYESDSLLINLSMLDGNHDNCSIQYVEPITHNTVSFPFIIKPQTEGYSLLKRYFETMVSCYQANTYGFELEFKACLYYFLHSLYTKMLSNIPKTIRIGEDVTERVMKILDYIKQNYTEPITINEMAKLLNFSEYHFMRFFKKYLGVTCVEYINSYRLDMAANQLYATNDSISKIALDNGFNTTSYFNKLFRQKYKMTPKEFRRSLSSS